jgi:hypothetical protein
VKNGEAGGMLIDILIFAIAMIPLVAAKRA